jgi:hypothetical protein
LQATRTAARLHQLLDRVREEAQILDRVREEAACSPCHRPRLSSLQPTVVQGRRRARDVRASYSARSPTLLLHVAIPCIAQLAARKRRGPLLFPRVCRRNRLSGTDLDLARRIQPFACEVDVEAGNLCHHYRPSDHHYRPSDRRSGRSDGR